MSEVYAPLVLGGTLFMTYREKLEKHKEISKKLMRNFNMEFLINSKAADIDITVYKSSIEDNDIIVLNGGHRDDLFVKKLLLKEGYTCNTSVFGYISSFSCERGNTYSLSYCNGLEGVTEFLGASSTAVAVMKKFCENKTLIDLTKMVYIRGDKLIRTDIESDKYHNSNYVNFGDILQ